MMGDIKIIGLLIFLLLFSDLANAQPKDERVQEPVKNFERLWKVFNDRYANFELKGVDWKASYEKYRPLVGENITNDSLFKICSDLLSSLEDGHVNLIMYNKDKKIIRLNEKIFQRTLVENFPRSEKKSPNLNDLLAVKDSTLLRRGFKDIFNISERLHFAISDKYGYLEIKAMSGLKMREIIKKMQQLQDLCADKDGLVVDIRFNGGGDDKVAFAIAGHFIKEPVVADFKRTRKKGQDSYTPRKKRILKPLGDKPFLKPILILTSDYTASAADVFALILKPLSHTLIIGDHTQGIFSDMYSFKLPNGWRATLSHQQYFSNRGVNYEGKGVPPDIKILNSRNDIITGKDTVLERALNILENN